VSRFAFAAAFVILSLAPAFAEPNLPDIAARARAYRETLEAAPKSAKISQLLPNIRHAQESGAAGQALHLYEQLVGLEPDNYRSWLKLGLSWREVENGADGGVHAAWNAYKAARAAPDQIEALLLMSSILRTQLESSRATYQADSLGLSQVETEIALLGACPDNPADLNDTSNLALACPTRAHYREEMSLSSARVGEIAHDLDEIYTDIANKLPGLDVQKMKSGDHRELDFRPVADSSNTDSGQGDQETLAITYKLDGENWRGCFEFTQELNLDAGVYAKFVELKPAPPDEPSDSENSDKKAAPEAEPIKPALAVQGRALCIDNLPPGVKFALTLKKGMRSKFGLEMSADHAGIEIGGPDIPSTVQFSGSRFVLPRSGPGKLEVRTINVDKFAVELFRITDRTLYRQIALGNLGGSKFDLAAEEYQGLLDHFGELLWRGTVTPRQQAAVNQPKKSRLPVRDLLNRRAEWVRERIGDKSQAPRETLASGMRHDFVGSDAEPDLTGEYFADSSEFEASATSFNPGVYALVTPQDSSCVDTTDRPCDRLVQWFLETDVGITFYEGLDKFNVVLRSLETGEAVTGVVQLVTAGNRVLSEATTDANGVATFPHNLTRGTQSNALTAIMAQVGDGKRGADFAFMAFNAERLDLSKLNVDGRVLTGGLDAFLTTDRGLYEPGQSIELTALIRDEKGAAVEFPPKAMIRLEARDHVLSQTAVESSAWQLGGMLRRILIPQETRAGPVRVSLSIGDEDQVIGETLIHVGPIKPDQVEIQFPNSASTWSARLDGGKLEAKGPVLARYLFAARPDALGAASNLRVESVVKVSAGETPREGCYADFVFGRHDEQPIASVSAPIVNVTDTQGAATLFLTGVDAPATTRPIAAAIDVTMYDSVGPVGSHSLVVPISDSRGWIGLARIPTLRPSATRGSVDLDLDIVRLTADNKPEGQHQLETSLFRERESYIWEVRDGAPQSTRSVTLEPTSFVRSISNSELTGAVEVGSGDAASGCVPRERIANLFQNIEMGRYVLKVEDKDTGRVATTRVQVGASQTDPDQLEPNIFVLSSDKTVYRPDEAIELSAQTPFDGPVLVGFARGDVERWVAGHAVGGVAKMRFLPPADWSGKGFYALATVFRANGASTPTAGPNRAIGAKYIEVSGRPVGFGAAIAITSPPALSPLAPGDDLKFRVCVARDSKASCPGDAAAPAGDSTEDVYAVAYVVDEGLIGLTGHHSPPPDPEAYFYGRRRLGVRIMDTYSRLLLTTGGDRPGRLALSNYTSESVVAMAEGPVKLKDGRADFTIRNPGLVNGKLSIFVIAWSKSYVATALSDVLAQSPVVADLNAPSFLLSGDSAIIPLRLVNFNVGARGDFIVRASVDGVPARVSFPTEPDDKSGVAKTEFRAPIPLPGTKTSYLTVTPDPGSRGRLSLTIDIAQDGADVALPGHRRTWNIDVRSPRLPAVTTISFPLQNSPTSLSKLVGDFVTARYTDPEQVSVTLRLSDGAEALLRTEEAKTETGPALTLDRLVAKAMAFFGDHARATTAEWRPDGEKLLGDILSLQSRGGSFLPYRTLGDPSSAEANYSETPAATAAALRRTALVLEIFALAKADGYALPAASLAEAKQFASTELIEKTGDVEKTGGKGIDPCSFEALLADWSLVLLDEMNSSDVQTIAACKTPDIGSEALVYAITSRFGSSDSARTMLATFVDSAKPETLKRLSGSEPGQIKLAMILKLLAEGGAEPKTREAIAEALMPTTDNPRPLSPMAAAWIPRDAPSPGGAPLQLADVHIDGSGLGDLRFDDRGFMQSARIKYASLKSSSTSLSVASAKTARAFVTLEGTLKNAKDEDALPAGVLRRRIYSAKDGHEINPNTEEIRIGDRLVVALEGDRKRLAATLSSEGPSELRAEDPLVLADLLPSAVSAYAETALDGKEFKTPEWVKKIGPIGDLRSATIEPDRWVGIVLPDSRKPLPTEGAAPTPTNSAPDGNLDFRVAYVVRVNLAGRFAWPGTILEGSSQFATTRHSDASQITFKPAEASAK
jgi:uncharacterized protein YfaS (alpha-2-macroglobulin family)